MVSQNGLAVASGTGLVLDDDRMELLRRSIANGAPPLEFEMFVASCNRRGLDPFAKQIYLIPRRVKNRDTGNYETKWVEQTGIDGFRVIADRTRSYAGSDEPVYDTEAEPNPNKATVTVWKLLKGDRFPFSASARWDEYCQRTRDGKPMGQWATMPYLMLAKCAESLALRKAFPEELSGLYTDAEMQQAENEPRPQWTPVHASHETAPQAIEPEQHPNDDRERANGEYFALVSQHGLTDEERHAIQRIAYQVESANQLDARQLRSLSKILRDNSTDELRTKIKRQAELDAQAGEEQQDVPDYSDHDPASPIPDFLERIRKATTEQQLNAVTQEMQAIGVWDASVVPAIVAKRKELGLPAPDAEKTPARTVNDIVDQVPVVDGEPGLDRHTS